MYKAQISNCKTDSDKVKKTDLQLMVWLSYLFNFLIHK